MASVTLPLTQSMIDGLDPSRPWVGVGPSGKPVMAAAPTKKEWFAQDSQVKGLYLRVSPGGAVSWGVRMRMGRANAVRRALGSVSALSLNDARRLARDYLSSMSQGRDPAQQKKALARQAEAMAAADRDTFGHIYERYVEVKAKASDKVKSNQDRAQVIRWMQNAPLWKVPFRDLGLKQVHATFTPLFLWAYGKEDTRPAWGPLGKAGKGRKKTEGARRPAPSVERCFTHCKTCWNWAAARAFPDGAPADPFGLWREDHTFRRATPKRAFLDTASDDDQAARWIKAVFAMREDERQQRTVMADYAVCLYLWATRKSETAHLTWAMVDWTARVLEVPSGLVKNSQAFALPLTPFILDLLRARQAKNAAWAEKQRRPMSPFIFPSRHEGKPLTTPYKALAEIATMAGLSEPLTPHALRRTAATETALTTSFNASMVSMLLNHTTLAGQVGGATKVYLHNRAQQLRPTMEARERAMLAMAGLAPPEPPPDPSAASPGEDLDALLKKIGSDPALKEQLLRAILSK